MLHRFFTVPLLLLAVFSSQTISAQHFTAGVSLGIAATQVDGDTYGGFNKAGPILGFWVGCPIAGDWYGRLGFRYIQKGSFAKTKTNGANGFYRLRLHYFDLPIVAGYRFVNGFRIAAGVAVSYLSDVKEVTELGPFPESELEEFGKFDLPFIVGLEYAYSEHWSFAANFSYSLFPIRPYRGNISYRLNRGQYNRVVEFIAIFKL